MYGWCVSYIHSSWFEETDSIHRPRFGLGWPVEENEGMRNISMLGIRLGAICAVAALCTGCPNPNTYGTPRTTPVGKIQHNVAAEGFGYSGHDVETNTDVSGA